MIPFSAYIPTIPFIFISVIYGLMIGSFLNVVIARLPQIIKKKIERSEEEVDDLVFKKSRCNKCRVGIKARHNIPVLGYLILKGRCFSCGYRFGVSYIYRELATGLTTGATAYLMGPTWQFLLCVVLSCAVIVYLGLPKETKQHIKQMIA